MDKTAEAKPKSDAPSKASAPTKGSRGKSILALSVFALGLNASAAVYTMSPADFSLPDVSRVAELLPHQKASGANQDTVVAALKDLQSAQQQHVASLQENSSSLQQNTVLLLQDSTTLAALRESITDEHADVKTISAQITDQQVDVKKMSAQLSTLIAKVDSLQSALTPEVTSSIPAARAHSRPSSVVRKRIVRQPKPQAPIAIGEPLSFPVLTPAPKS